MWNRIKKTLLDKIESSKEMIHNRTFYKAGALTTLVLGICICIYCITQKEEGMEVGNTYGDRKLPIYCVETDQKVVALSFDAAWGNEDTLEILEILERQDVKVTFFMTGGWVEAYPEDVKMIYEAGHDLGNHSENHLNMSELSMTEIEEEIMLVHNRVKELTGCEMCLFRPPYGDYDNDVITGVENCGYYAVQWSVDSLDWKDYGVDSIIQTVTCHKNLGCGSIILCHNGAKYTADALEEMIIALKEQGYTFVKISDLIYREDYEMDVTGRQYPCE